MSKNRLIEKDNKCYEFWSFEYGPDTATGTYTWSIQGKTLILKVVGVDVCPARKLIFTSHHLLKQA